MRVPDEIRATLVDHIVNHGRTMAKAGRRVQPNVWRTTVLNHSDFSSTEQVCKKIGTVLQYCILSVMLHTIL